MDSMHFSACMAFSVIFVSSLPDGSEWFAGKVFNLQSLTKHLQSNQMQIRILVFRHTASNDTHNALKIGNMGIVIIQVSVSLIPPGHFISPSGATSQVFRQRRHGQRGGWSLPN